MSDERLDESAEDDVVKDFTYYADSAEEWLTSAQMWTDQVFNPRLFEHALKSASVYACLAAAVPVTLTTEKANNPGNFFYFIHGRWFEGERCTGKLYAMRNGFKVDDMYKQCILRQGHDVTKDKHLTEDGLLFHD